MTIRFDQAWRDAYALAEEFSNRGIDVLLVRNLLGIISAIVGDENTSLADGDLAGMAQRLQLSTGPFSANSPVMRWSDLSVASSLAEDPSRTVVRQRSHGVGRLVLVERTVVGAEWSSVASQPPNRRLTLYGFKGGVGRSTAAVLLARHLATEGRCVLVVDLDLESPGVSSLLVDDQQLPEHGLVDHLVEGAVRNAEGLELVVRSRVADVTANGEVWIAPAAGRPRAEYSYLPKLNRAYLDSPPFADRLSEAVTACEDQVSAISRPPDVVLLDSRAGLHDIAAVAITRLSNLSFLFAANNAHTWAGYGELFRGWSADSVRARGIRGRLKMVASAVPSARSEYLAVFRDRAQACLAALYDNALGGDPSFGGPSSENYNPALEDRDAPHWPLPISFVPGMVGIDPVASREWLRDPQVQAAFVEFVEGAADLVERSEQ
jgi:AAA domain